MIGQVKEAEGPLPTPSTPASSEFPRDFVVGDIFSVLIPASAAVETARALSLLGRIRRGTGPVLKC